MSAKATETMAFGHGADEDVWSGAVLVTVAREVILQGPRSAPVECITVATDDGDELRGTVEDMRRLGETLIRMAGR